MNVQDPEIEVIILEKEKEAPHMTGSQGEKIDPKTQTYFNHNLSFTSTLYSTIQLYSSFKYSH